MSDAAELIDVLTRIREQLSRTEADELAFYAAHDPALFCAMTLAKASAGEIALPQQLRRTVRRRLLDPTGTH